MLKLSHLMVIIPVALLLTVSFFVLLSLRKVEEKGLKAFGRVVVGLLWLAALVVFLVTVSNFANDCFRMKYMMQQKMRAPCMSQMMQNGGMSGMAMPEKNLLLKDKKPSEASKCGGNKGLVSKGQ